MSIPRGVAAEKSVKSTGMYPPPVLAEGLKAFKWLALQKAFSEAFKVLNKILKG
jgi:hypothetical protein